MAIVWHGVIIKVCSENGKSVMTISLHDDKWVSIWADDKALPFLLSLLELSLLLLWGAARLRQQQQAAKLISWNDRSPRPWLYHHGTRQPKREHQDGQGPNSSDLGYIFQIYKLLLGRPSHAQFPFPDLQVHVRPSESYPVSALVRKFDVKYILTFILQSDCGF